MSCTESHTENTLARMAWSGTDVTSWYLARLFEIFEVPFALVPYVEDSEAVRLPFDLPECAIDVIQLAEITAEPQLEEVTSNCWVLAIPVPAGFGTPQGVAVARLTTAAGRIRAISPLADLLSRSPESARLVILRWARSAMAELTAFPEEDAALPALERSVGLVVQRLLDGIGNPLVEQLASVLPAVLPYLQAEGIAWVPANRRQRCVVAGTLSMDETTLRRMVYGVVRTPPVTEDCWIVTGVPALTKQGVDNLVVVTGGGRHQAGWLAAINGPSIIGREKHILRAMTSIVSAIHAVARAEQMARQFHSTVLGFLQAMTAAIDAKDPYTRGHSERVARMAEILGCAAGLDAARCSQLRVAGLLHDIGKIGINDEILKKEGPLTEAEWDHIKRHVEIGVAILKHVPSLKHLIPGVRAHHERYDGKGYPDGLSGEQIPLEGRIIAVADAFDAMSSDRSYRRRRNPEEIRKIFLEGAGSQWDPRIIHVALTVWDELIAVREGTGVDSLARAIAEAVVDRATAPDERSVVASGDATVIWEI